MYCSFYPVASKDASISAFFNLQCIKFLIKTAGFLFPVLGFPFFLLCHWKAPLCGFCSSLFTLWFGWERQREQTRCDNRVLLFIQELSPLARWLTRLMSLYSTSAEASPPRRCAYWCDSYLWPVSWEYSPAKVQEKCVCWLLGHHNQYLRSVKSGNQWHILTVVLSELFIKAHLFYRYIIFWYFVYSVLIYFITLFSYMCNDNKIKSNPT